MADSIRQEYRVYNYRDYASWNDGKRWEIIEGKAYGMAPAPGERHQGVSGALFYSLYGYLIGKNCRVYSAPFDVAFPEEGETFDTATNVVQPDIVVICDREKIIPSGCCGAPDLIIEILSPSTAVKDMKNKRLLYQKFGVKEYWVVDPIHGIIQIYKGGKDGKYGFPETYSSDDKVKIGIFDDLTIDLSNIF